MKRIRLIFVLVAVILLAVVGVVIVRSREPRYEGRTLTEWIADTDGNPTNSPVWQNASRALKHMAPEALPQLLRLLQSKDSRLRQKVAGWVNDYLHLHVRRDYENVMTAEDGFALLGENAKPAWPVLIRLTQSPDADTRGHAFLCLSCSGVGKQVLMPIGIRLLRDRDRFVQRGVAFYLAIHYPEEADANGVYKTFPDLKLVPHGQ